MDRVSVGKPVREGPQVQEPDRNTMYAEITTAEIVYEEMRNSCCCFIQCVYIYIIWRQEASEFVATTPSENERKSMTSSQGHEAYIGHM